MGTSYYSEDIQHLRVKGQALSNDNILTLLSGMCPGGWFQFYLFKFRSICLLRHNKSKSDYKHDYTVLCRLNVD